MIAYDDDNDNDPTVTVYVCDAKGWLTRLHVLMWNIKSETCDADRGGEEWIGEERGMRRVSDEGAIGVEEKESKNAHTHGSHHSCGWVKEKEGDLFGWHAPRRLIVQTRRKESTDISGEEA